MIKGLLLGLVAFLAGCATVDRLPTDYAGHDAGRVVISMGAATGTSYSSYSLLFRKRGSDAAENKPVGRFTYFQTNMFYKQTPDYHSGDEAGVVLIHSLPPGDYEIYNFDVFFNGGMVQKNFFSKIDVSIPFSVRSGETTYLGNYQANRLTGHNIIGISIPAGAVFAVSDRLKDELPIAQVKSKGAVDTAKNATPDPKAIGNPFFVSRQ